MRIAASTLSLTAALVLMPVFSGCAKHKGDRIIPPGDEVLSQVIFESQLPISASVPRVSDVAVGDLTGDGRLDAAVVDLDGAVQILVGQGGGVFLPGTRTSVDTDGSEIRAVDLDGDLDLDLVVASFRQDTVSILENTGSGDFVAGAVLTTAAIPTSLAVRDCNDDDIFDVIVAHFSPSRIEVFLGNGDGTFAPSVFLAVPSGGRTAGLAVADVTGDGFSEVLVADTDRSQALIYLGDSQGLHSTVVEVPVAGGPFGLAVGELTGDGVQDIVVTNFSARTVQVLASDATNTVRVIQEVPFPGQPGFVSVGDVTGDGLADVIVSEIGRMAIAVYANTGNENAPLAVTPTVLGTVGFPYRPVPADVNDDGRGDLIVPGAETDILNVFLAREIGLAGSRHHEASFGFDPMDLPSLVAKGDLDLDGDDEVVTAALDEPRAIVLGALAPTDGTDDPVLGSITEIDFRDRVLADGEIQRHVSALHIADVDADGKLDVIAAVTGGIKIAFNDSVAGQAPSFSVLPISGVFAEGQGGHDIAVTDVDADGLLDLIVAYDTDQQLRVARGMGGRQFEPATATNVSPGGPGGLAVGDFDGSGRVQVAVSVLEQAVIRFFAPDANGQLVFVRDEAVGAVPTRLDVTDLNGDGASDLVVSNSDADSLSLLVAVGGGVFNRTDVPVGASPLALLTEDLNRDGNPDILVASLIGREFRVLLGDGSGGVSQSIAFPGVFTAVDAELLDLNGDTLPDLVISGFETGRLAVYKNISR